jgi:hypothetical protein
LRDSPVSILRWTRAGRSLSRTAAVTVSSCQTLLTEMSTSAASARRIVSASSGVQSQDSNGAVIPAARRSSASSTIAVPSQLAPPASAARADSTSPCP